MSGGGGGWSWPTASDRQVESAVAEATKTSGYQAQANAYLQELLTDYNDRDVSAIQTHLDTLKAAIEKEIEGEISTLFGG